MNQCFRCHADRLEAGGESLDDFGMLGCEVGSFAGIGVSSAADCPSRESDHDGQDNLHEYLAGMSPTDPASVFEITSVTRDAGGNVLLQWPSVSGKSYAI